MHRSDMLLLLYKAQSGKLTKADITKLLAPDQVWFVTDDRKGSVCVFSGDEAVLKKGTTVTTEQMADMQQAGGWTNVTLKLE